MLEGKCRDVLYPRVHEVDRRRGPALHAQLERRLHGDLGGAREDRREPLLLSVLAEGARRRHVHCHDEIDPQRSRRGGRQVVHRGAVHVVAAANLARRQVAGHSAGGEHGVGDAHVLQALGSPEHLHAGVDVDGVDDQRPLELREGEVAHEPVEQFVERLAAEQGGGPHPLERHVGVRHDEDVPAAQVDGDLVQRLRAVTRRPRGAHERAHARPDDAGGREPALREGLEHADVREPLHPASAEHQTEACIGIHVVVPLARKVSLGVT